MAEWRGGDRGGATCGVIVADVLGSICLSICLPVHLSIKSNQHFKGKGTVRVRYVKGGKKAGGWRRGRKS